MTDSSFYELLVGEVMDRNPPLVAKDASLFQVANIVDKENHAWVVDSEQDRKILGIITEKDLLDIVSLMPSRSYTIGTIKPKSLHHTELEKAGDFMSRPVVKCHPNTRMEKALCLLVDHRIRRLAVAENDEIIGELNLNIVINTYFKYCKL